MSGAPIVEGAVVDPKALALAKTCKAMKGLAAKWNGLVPPELFMSDDES